jgi:asparagine synthase (glutamine-hydrolysing)
MCGISGYIKKGKAVTAANILAMNTAIRHRGPDDEGYLLVAENAWQSFHGPESVPEIKEKIPALPTEIHSNIALGFRRLSILELSDKGHQPMVDGQVALTFNGEIYNYKALRQQLQIKGHKFHSNSDTEVILRAYREWGIDMVQHLNGMFAIAITDLQTRKIYLLRDRVGMKPLFYYKDETHLTWCSEIKGILEAEWVQASMSMEGLILNYQFKTTPPPYTCFENIYSVPPAHILTLDIENLSVHIAPYWEIPSRTTSEFITEEEAIESVKEKLKQSIALHMQADVPLVTMMSGGVDSTLVTALAHEHDPEISSYTLAIDGSGAGLDELPQAQRMAQKLGINQLIQHISEEDIVNNALTHFAHFEEPYNSLDVIFDASRFLRDNGYKVILSGNGADEVFGGYAYNLNLPKWQRIRRFSFLAPFLPKGDARMQRLKYYLSLKNVGQFFLSTTGGMRVHHISDLLSLPAQKKIKQITDPLLEQNNFETAYQGLFYYDLKYSVGAHHVYHDDICSMKYSVEMRYPYLDHELIELVACLPEAYRFNGKINKPLLRKVARNYIAQDNLQMPKKGFNLPQDQALANNRTLQDFVAQQIAYLKTTGIFDADAMDQILRFGRQNNYSNYIWQLVSTAVWMQKYL